MKYHNDDIYVKSSAIHGLGLFTKEKIEQNSLIIKCPYCIVPKQYLETDTFFSNEEIEFMKTKSILPFFNYLCSMPFNIIQNKNQEIFVLFLGLTSFINKTNDTKKENVTFILSNEGEYKNIFLFSTKSINKDEELLTSYDLEHLDVNSNYKI